MDTIERFGFSLTEGFKDKILGFKEKMWLEKGNKITKFNEV